MLKGTGSGAPTKDDVKSLASAETARLRLRRVALGGASMASELLVAKHTKETAHSSRTKEFFQLEANKVLRVSPSKGAHLAIASRLRNLRSILQ